jgi:hypothetical protein
MQNNGIELPYTKTLYMAAQWSLEVVLLNTQPVNKDAIRLLVNYPRIVLELITRANPLMRNC